MLLPSGLFSNGFERLPVERAEVLAGSEIGCLGIRSSKGCPCGGTEDL